ncbi:MAG: hypothetical protein IJJ72_07955 [Bacteroidales bacterium]|nr:hypothetical protein [Bacteroidales bacterium]
MSKKVKLVPYRSPLQLKSRFDKLRELSEADHVNIDNVEFKFEGPECGWLDVEVLRDGESVYYFNMSDVYEPFKALNRWLLSLLNEWPTTTVFHFDAERYDQEITCDFIGLLEEGESCKAIALFTFSADWEDSYDPAFVIMPVNEFVRKFYYGLLDYYIANKQVFMQDWGNECEWEDNHYLLDAIIADKEIEKIIPRIGPRPEIFKPTTDVPVTEADAFARIDAMVTEEDKKLLIETPRSDEAIAKTKSLGLWIRNNWIYSPDGESHKMKVERSKCFRMMSNDELAYDFSWCFTDAHYVSFGFLDRYIEYLKGKKNK